MTTDGVQLNATVWHTLNSSAVAPGNYPVRITKQEHTVVFDTMKSV
jgi:hypothetical protein